MDNKKYLYLIPVFLLVFAAMAIVVSQTKAVNAQDEIVSMHKLSSTCTESTWGSDIHVEDCVDTWEFTLNGGGTFTSDYYTTTFTWESTGDSCYEAGGIDYQGFRWQDKSTCVATPTL